MCLFFLAVPLLEERIIVTLRHQVRVGYELKNQMGFLKKIHGTAQNIFSGSSMVMIQLKHVSVMLVTNAMKVVQRISFPIINGLKRIAH